jgi:hypothetical protein
MAAAPPVEARVIVAHSEQEHRCGRPSSAGDESQESESLGWPRRSLYIRR